MQLIRKRLKIEFWLDDQLKFLFNVKVNLNKTNLIQQHHISLG
jgi:hypothetical protein